MCRGNIQTVPKIKANITRHVSSIDRETLRKTVQHAVTSFEYALDVNWMHIE